jgi:undecaprenyl-diphosphatase
VLDAILGADMTARAWVVGHRIGLLDRPMWLLSVVGRGGMVFLAIAALISAGRRRWQALATTAAAILITFLIVDHVAKPLVGRERPFAAAPAVPVIGGRPDDPSFPSGHAANAAAGAFTLSASVPQLAPFWWALAAAIAYSRVYVGVHYPIDVIAGAAAGTLIAAGVEAVARTWRGRRGSG